MSVILYPVNLEIIQATSVIEFLARKYQIRYQHFKKKHKLQRIIPDVFPNTTLNTKRHDLFSFCNKNKISPLKAFLKINPYATALRMIIKIL